MKAVALTRYLPVTDPASLADMELPDPVATGRDLLVRIEAISVNPVDTKVRSSRPGVTEPEPRVLGWDAAGIVAATGPDATLFKVGDAVWYAGSITRPGANSELHLVDERIVGRKPQTLSFAEAAALPLTALTAWEALFERLGIDRAGAQRGRSLLMIGGAGGVGSIAIQLACLAGLDVIATASRPETQAWVRELGAQHVIDHRQPLRPQLEAAGFGHVDYIANFADTDRYWEAMADLIRPQGKIVSIVENAAPLDIGLLKAKSASFAWEFMFTRAMFATDDMIEQHRILNEIATLVEAGTLRTTLTETLGPIHAANLRAAHARLESGRTIGKLALAGWQ
ncbi:zinc-binding alcohol dehydrogenase family protein [Opitutaceae bacterium TAV1]|nr:zinc-binding alcohol dehydrogenase family protein [Opitutaceae bacterium TAV1]